MKTYPSITHKISDHQIYAFDKLDGSNIRAEWSRKNGFHKFGSRKRLIDKSTEVFGESIDLILEKYSENLSKIFRDQRWQKAIAFFEFHGPNSFAGNHDPEDKKTVTLFDVAADKKGLLEPVVFLKLFKDVDTASMLYHGKANETFVSEVKESKLEGMTFEGVICKGKYQSPGLPLMFKVKNQAWFEKLRSYCKDDEELFKNLS